MKLLIWKSKMRRTWIYLCLLSKLKNRKDPHSSMHSCWRPQQQRLGYSRNNTVLLTVLCLKVSDVWFYTNEDPFKYTVLMSELQIFVNRATHALQVFLLLLSNPWLYELVWATKSFVSLLHYDILHNVSVTDQIPFTPYIEKKKKKTPHFSHICTVTTFTFEKQQLSAAINVLLAEHLWVLCTFTASIWSVWSS